MTDWRESANCLGTDPEVFYPPPSASMSDAKRLCQPCPVREECLDWALEQGERFGVWGGLGPKERDGERRRRKIAGVWL